MFIKAIFIFFQPLWYLYDWITPKRKNWWAFSTHHLHGNRFIENQRALFEHIKEDPSIHKVIFHRGNKEDLQIHHAANYETVNHGTIRALILLARCKVLFVTHSIAMDYSFRWKNKDFSILKISQKNRIVVNLWHSISVKKLLYVTNDQVRKHTDRIRYRSQERKKYAGLISSSDIDSYAMSAMFYPLNYRQVWITGLPRNDFLTQSENLLPEYILDSLQEIRQMKKGKKLILYAPTYRQTTISEGAYYYQFTTQDIKKLKTMLTAHNAILGYRPHYFKNSTQYFNLCDYVDNKQIFDMSGNTIKEFSALARECDLLITDYSSVYIETLYLGKPIVCFGYDIDHYMAHEDGLLYDMDLVFPGPIVHNIDDLIIAVESRLNEDQSSIDREQSTAKKIFFKYNDAMNSCRVKNEIFKRL